VFDIYLLHHILHVALSRDIDSPSPSSSPNDRSPLDFDNSDLTPLSGTFLQKDKMEIESGVELSVTSRGSTENVKTVS